MTKHLLLTLLTLLGSSVLIPCGDYADPDYSYYNFFEQESINDASLYRFLRSSADYYIPVSGALTEVADQNADEWQKYWGGAVSLDAVNSIVYGSELEDIQIIQKNMKKPANMGTWSENEVVQYCIANKETASLAYLAFANKCEPFLGEPEFDWETYTYMPRNTAPMLALAKEGEKAYKKEKKPALKMRYAFQVVRLLHYAGEYAKAVEAFNRLAEPLGTKDYMYYRALEQVAGAYHRQNLPEASYYFAKVFEQCPDRRETCLRSFAFTNNMNWESGLKMCQNNSEKTTFYAIRGLITSVYGFPVEELENIAKLDPNSPYLELLLARQINYCERMAFSMYSEFGSLEDIEKDPSLPRLQQLANSLSMNGEVKNRDFWRVSEGYLSLFMRRPADCRAAMAKIPAGTPFYNQAKVLDFVAQLVALERIDEKTEIDLATNFTSQPVLRDHKHVRALMMDIIGDLYFKSKHLPKAYLCHNSIVNLANHLDITLIDALQAFIKKTNKNKMEELLADNASLNENSWNELQQMRGTYHLERGDYAKAIAAFQDLPAAYRKTDPQFNKTSYLNKTIFSYLRINPVYEAPIEYQAELLYKNHSYLDKDYDKMVLAKTLQDLEQKAQSRPDSAATYYFLLGCAWANLSAKGWHRPALSYYESNYNYSGWWYTGTKVPELESMKNFSWAEFHYYDPERILAYFDKAYAAAKDKEMKAKITFAAAQIEQEMYYVAASDYNNNLSAYALPSERPNHQKYFGRLKNEFEDTEYVKNLLSECYYLAVYFQ